MKVLNFNLKYKDSNNYKIYGKPSIMIFFMLVFWLGIIYDMQVISN